MRFEIDHTLDTMSQYNFVAYFEKKNRKIYYYIIEIYFYLSTNPNNRDSTILKNITDNNIKFA